MPEKSRINLHNILKVEREERKKLVPLEEDFYENVAGQIQDLEEDKRKIDDPYSTKYAIIEDEQKTVKNAIESIIYKRTTKIINEARYNAELSLYETSRQKENHNIDSMAKEERKFYNRLLEVMTEWRSEVVNNIFRKEKKENTVNHQDPVIDEAPSRPPEGNKDIVTANVIDKKDISKEYIVVRLLKDIPTFVGVDGRNYTLSKEDVAVLSTVNAKALINRKAAIQIMVNR